MPICVEEITDDQSRRILVTEEGQFADLKSKDIKPSKLTRATSAFANSDGGELYVGIDEGENKVRTWRGFRDQEEANGHIQAFETLFPLGKDVSYEFLRCPSQNGLVLHLQVAKTQAVINASNGTPYVRRIAANYPADTPEKLKRLLFLKGIVSFEREIVNAPEEMIVQSEVTQKFVSYVVPRAEPAAWLKKQALLQDGKPTVAGIILFADEPQAALPKQCGIKIYQYKTRETQGFRDALAFTPRTVEGCAYDQIKEAVRLTAEIAQSIPRLGDEALEAIQYPTETLHEIITNAVIHRDYSVADDVHIRIFENRIEVQSPGRFPAHVTTANYLTERFARNGAIVRILNKFPDPPNKDVGEGLNTAFEAMHKLGLKEPLLVELENAVLATIRHEPLASPEGAINEYLESHETINNAEAREITHIRADYQVKSIFGRMVEKGMIEQVPGTRTSNTRYRKPRATAKAAY